MLEHQTALFVGGPWHGRVEKVERGAQTWIVPIPSPVTLDALTPTKLPEIKTCVYRRRLYERSQEQFRRLAFVADDALDEALGMALRMGDGDLVRA